MDNDSNVSVKPEETVKATAPVQSAFAKPSSKRSPKMMIGGILAGALILLGGGGTLAYTQWYQNSDKVVHDAIINSIQAKSLSTTGTMKLEMEEGFDLDLTFDSKSAEEGDGEFNVKAKIAIDNDEMKQDFNVDGSGRIVDNTLYFKVSGIKKIVEDVAEEEGNPIPAYATSIVDKVEDKWISVKPSDYADMDAEMSKQQECTMDLMKKMQSDKDMKKEVTDLYKKNQIVTVKEKLGSKSVNGTGSLGYEVDLSQDAAESFVRGLKDTKLGDEMKKCDEDIDFDEAADDIAKDNERDEDTVIKAELWVSRFGHRITEFSLDVSEKDSSNKMSLDLQPTFNTKAEVEAPSDAISLKDLMEDIQNAMMQEYMNMHGLHESDLELSA